MTTHRPCLVTESLDLAVRAEGLRPHRRGVLVDLIGEARVSGDLVWQGRTTYLNRSATLGEPPDEPAVAAEEPGLSTAGAWRLPANLGRRYAAVSGDVNPIHLSPLAAKAFGFPRTVAHGMWTHARCLAALAPRLPDAFRVDVDFTKPVLLPSTVRFGVGRTPDGFIARLTDRAGDKAFLRLAVGAVPG